MADPGRARSRGPHPPDCRASDVAGSCRQSEKATRTPPGRVTRKASQSQAIVPSGGIVLDPFMGSGTTGAHAERLADQPNKPRERIA